MRNLFSSTALAFAVFMTALPIQNASAASITIGPDGVTVQDRERYRDRCDPRREDCGGYDRDRGDRDDYDRGFARRECTPERALAKADRMGIRRARIINVSRRTIDIAGRSRDGDRIFISFFKRDRTCPVIR
jgi:hypothetical protein